MKLSVQNGCFSYRAGQPLLENISFEAEGGDVLAILGPNGAGKTTLLKCMLNLLHWRQGQTLLDGEDVGAMPVRALWQKVAYVPQAKQTSLFCTVEHALRRANQALLLGRGGKSVCGKTCEVVTEDRISEFFGVRAVIGEMQTPLGVSQDVIPVSIGCRE